MLDDERTSAPSEATASSASPTGDGSAEPAAPRKTTRRRKATAAPETGDATATAPSGDAEAAPKKTAAPRKRTTKKTAPAAEVETPSAAGAPIPATAVIFQAPEPAAPAKAAKKTAAKKTAAKSAAKKPAKSASSSAVAGVELTHADRVVYPDLGLTKREREVRDHAASVPLNRGSEAEVASSAISFGAPSRRRS